MFSIYYLAISAISVYVLYRFSDRRQRCGAIVVVALLFGVIGFCMSCRPGRYVDTVRFFETLDGVRTHLAVGIPNAWTYLMEDMRYSSTPIMGIILFALAFLRENGWLLLLTASIDYLCAFIMIRNVCNGSDNKVAFVLTCAFFIAVFNFNESVSGVRNVLVASAACLVVQSSLSEKLRFAPSLLFLLGLSLIHPFGIFIVALFLFSKLSRNKLAFSAFGLLLVGQRLFQGAAFMVLGWLSPIPFFESLSIKALQYFGPSAYLVSDSIFGRVRDILLAVSFAFLIMHAIKRRVSKFSDLAPFDKFSLLFLCFTLGALLDEELFERLVSTLPYIVLPYVYEIVLANISVVAEKRILRCGGSRTLLFIIVFALVCLLDNIRAGVKFQVMSFSIWPFVPLAVFLIARQVWLHFDAHAGRASNKA